MSSNNNQRPYSKGYQNLFAMNLNELGKTSLVQHDIKLNV